MDQLPRALILIPALTLTASIIEALILHFRKSGSYDWRSFGVSLFDFTVRNVQRFTIPGLLVSPLATWAWEHRVWTVPLQGFAAFALLFVGQEFCYYWYHRASHRVRLMWATHAVHHLPNLEYLDGNYGGVTVIFDRLFGTYIPERADLPSRYGWVVPITSNNPFKVELHQWACLGRDLLAARSLREVLGTLFMPPGWKAQGAGQTTEELRREALQS